MQMLVKHSISLFAALLVCSNTSLAQTVERTIINSTGGTANAGTNFFIDYSVGEAVITTGNTGTNYFTQGFLQPDTVFASSSVFSIGLFYAPETCINRNDGYIYANALNAVGPVTWLWQPNGDTVPSLTDLSPGTYILIANDTAGNSVVDTVVLTPSTSPCDLDFFNGISPNNDGKNDAFIISNISSYPQNALYIFNRYGTKVWQGENYDNVNVLFVGKDLNGNELPPATYFFILVVDGGERKGWLELFR